MRVVDSCIKQEMWLKKNAIQKPQQDFVLLSPFPASQRSSSYVKLKGIAIANLTALNFSVVYLLLGGGIWIALTTTI